MRKWKIRARRGARLFTDEEDQQIRALAADGLSASLIGLQLNRTRNSIIGRLHRIGIFSRKVTVAKENPTNMPGYKPPRAKKAKPPVVEILPPEPPPLVPVADPVNILGLKDGPIVQCRAIVAEQPEVLYCATRTVDGGAWCQKHSELFFNPQAPRVRR